MMICQRRRQSCIACCCLVPCALPLQQDTTCTSPELRLIQSGSIRVAQYSLLSSHITTEYSGDLHEQGGEEGDLRRYWSMVTRLEPGAVDLSRRPMHLSSEGVSVSELKRVIELQPLETPAAAAVASRLALLNPPQFSALLGELARDNHAFR